MYTLSHQIPSSNRRAPDTSDIVKKLVTKLKTCFEHLQGRCEDEQQFLGRETKKQLYPVKMSNNFRERSYETTAHS